MTPFEEAASRVARGADATAEALALVAAMTLDEVLGCLDGDTPFWPGLVDMTTGGYYRHPWPASSVVRLGVPGFTFSDGPRGVVVGAATCFPVSMARGATFDPDLEERIGEAIGAELAASGATFTGAVCVNLLRHPAWGRAQETYGEDPHHVGEMGAALTRGLQRHVLACVKHFACNSMENARFTVDVHADERALHEVYLPHFRRVVDEGVAAVMSAYNSVNGEWCGQNADLLTTVLRDEWGFDGFVVSDFIFGLRDAVASVRAGLDVEMPFRQQRAQHLPAALEAGDLDRADAERCAVRVVATLLRFWPIIGRPAPDPSVLASPSHRALAREAAQRSIVLLRNEGDLVPVDGRSLHTVAVLGRLAAEPNLGDGGSSDVHPPSVVTPLDGLRAALGPDRVRWSADEARIAAGADLAVVVVGFTKADEGEFIGAGVEGLGALFPPVDDAELGMQAAAPSAPSTSPEMAPGGDRRSLRLHADDEDLIRRTVAVNPRTVVVVMGGSAVVMPWADDVAAVLQLWYPGMEGGHGLADVLLGRVPPSGRLPFAVPLDESDLVAFDPDATAVTYGLLHGQWHLDASGVAAQFPFGFGLSTTSFEHADVALADDAGQVSLTVANTGTRDGVDVVQVYARCESRRFERPPWRLVGFRRVEVPAGSALPVEVPVRLEALDVRDAGRWVVEPGEVVLRVARHAADPGIEVRATRP